MRRCPCHVCGRTVAHYDLVGRPPKAFRGSVSHKCPHGNQCRGGSKLDRWGHQGYAPNCKPCSERLKLVCDANRHPPVDGEEVTPENIFRTAYKILTFYASAPDDAASLKRFLEHYIEGQHEEWAFGGSIAGTFYRRDGRYFIVCDAASQTPSRERLIAYINEQLARLPLYHGKTS